MKINQINLLDTEIEGGKSYLDAIIKENGELVLEGCDNGEMVREFWGDFDYEYWITIKKDYKDTMLLHLLKEKFDNQESLKEWLKEKNIPWDFMSYA